VWTGAPLRLAVVLVGVGSLLLAAGSETSWLLLAGRFVSGVASGAALAPGSAWIAELSHQDGPGAGARRTTIALSIGFGFGPLIAGLIAQWAPLPELTPQFGAHRPHGDRTAGGMERSGQARSDADPSIQPPRRDPRHPVLPRLSAHHPGHGPLGVRHRKYRERRPTSPSARADRQRGLCEQSRRVGDRGHRLPRRGLALSAVKVPVTDAKKTDSRARRAHIEGRRGGG
jgi:hypothetical protein